MTYTKTCKICGCIFESEARNTIYCSEKCSKKGAKKAYRSHKMKHINAVRRGDDTEIENLVTAAYKLARDVAKLCLIKKCSCTDPDHVCDSDLCVHHINHNPFDNRIENLQWVCDKYHHQIHADEEDCTIQDEIRAYITIRKQAEIRERNAAKLKAKNNLLQEQEPVL